MECATFSFDINFLAEIRYRGFLTGHTKDEFDMDYREGMERQLIFVGAAAAAAAAETQPKEEHELQVAYDSGNRQKCSISLNNDHPDFFYVASNQGWFHKTLPTSAEQDAYGNAPALGHILLCFASCEIYNKPKCTGDELKMDELSQALEIQVNGKMAELVILARECAILKRQMAVAFPANEEGRYLIKVRINPNVVNATAKQKIVRISSIIVF
jgi:hypothetical protein